MAKQIGFEPRELLKEKLMRFLAANGIQTYDYEEVRNYLNKTKPERTKWEWIPLRSKDRHYESQPRYGRLIPLRALQKVALIEEKFPESSLKFFVSDYVSENPDPFLAVNDGGLNYVVIDVWDEPGFGL